MDKAIDATKAVVVRTPINGHRISRNNFKHHERPSRVTTVQANLQVASQGCSPVPTRRAYNAPRAPYLMGGPP